MVCIIQVNLFFYIAILLLLFIYLFLVLERKYFCDICGKSYRYPKGLKHHQKYECEREPQFPCPHCPYRAKQKVHLRKHVFLKHGIGLKLT